MAPFALLMALLFTALSIDAGRLWFERRATQRAADMAALASARFTGCGSDQQKALNAAQATATANGIDASTVTLLTGVLTSDKAGNNVFTAAPVGNSNATQVRLTRTVPASVLLRGLPGFDKDVIFAATAVAQGGPPVATYSVGSVYGVSAETAKQLTNFFKAVLGNTSPTFDTAAVTALVNATTTLDALVQANNELYGESLSLDAFLKKSMTLSDFLQVIAKASTAAGDLQAFKDLETAADKLPKYKPKPHQNELNTFLVSQILNIQSPPAAGVSTTAISVFDLVNASMNVGAINLGGVLNFSFGLNFLGNTTLSIISPPIIAIGPAGTDSNGNWCSQAQSAQMSLRSTLAPFKFAGGLDLSIIDIAFRVDTLITSGHLEELSVVPGNISGKLSSQSTIVTLVLTNSNDVDKPIANKDNFGIGYIGFKFLNTGFKIYLPLGESKSEDTTFSFASKADLPSTKILGAGGVGDTFGGLLGTDTYIEARLLGIKVPISKLGNILGLVTQPLGAAIDGLLAAMGIQTGSVKMQVIDVSLSPPILKQ